jgi:hypothetical protein
MGHPERIVCAVLKDRRQSPRQVINRIAKFHAGGGSLPRDCMVTDISENGARLFSEADMPEQFTLSLSGEGTSIRRECRVVWRLGGELGVEFIRR